MLPPKVRAVYLKELRDCLRDRRVILASVIVPVLIYPVMMLGMTEVLLTTQARLSKAEYKVAIPKGSKPFFDKLLDDANNGENLDDIPGFNDTDAQLRKLKNNVIKSATKSGAMEEPKVIPLVFNDELDPLEAEKKLASGEVQAIVGLPPDFEARVAAGEQAAVEVRYDLAEHRSVETESRVQTLFERFKRRTLNDRLKAHGMQVTELHPFEFKPMNVADAPKMGGAIFSLLPMLFIIMIITGALHPAIDMTAGEKERSTLETLIVTPVRPIEIIAGKFLAVATLALASAALNVTSFGCSFVMMRDALPQLAQFGFPWHALPLVLLLLAPLTLFFAAALLAVASFAANHKEAGIYCMPVFLIPIVGMVLVNLPDVELGGPLLLMPVMNVALMIKEMLLRHGTAEQFIFVFVSTCLYAAGMVALAARVFAREEILFSAQGGIRLFLSRRFFKPSPKPKIGDALLVAAFLFPLSFYVQNGLATAIMGSSGITTKGIAFVMIVSQIGLFLLLPIVIAWYLKVKFQTTFQWRIPTIRAVAGAVLTGCGACFIALQMHAIQSHFWPAVDLSAFEKPLTKLAETTWGLIFLVFLIGVLPAVCEEHFFRGFLQQGIAGKKKWAALIAVGVIFGAFHLPLFRQPIVMVFGVVLAFIAYETRSIWPGIIVHFLFNSLMIFVPNMISSGEKQSPGELLPNVPLQWLIPAVIVFAIGLLLVRRPRAAAPEPSLDSVATASGS